MKISQLLLFAASLTLATHHVTAATGGAALAGVTVRISFESKKGGATGSDGSIKLSEGKLLDLAVLPVSAGSAQGVAWKITAAAPAKPAASGKGRLKKAAGKAQAQQQLRAPEVIAVLDAPASAEVTVALAAGSFGFKLGELAFGKPRAFLDGRVSVERAPTTLPLTNDPTEDDLPAAATGRDGTVWVVFNAYKLGNLPEEQGGNFDSFVTKGNGDKLRLVKFDGAKWSEPMDVTAGGLDLWRPTIAVDGAGRVWVVWSQNTGGNWDLHASSYDPASGKWSEDRRLTDAPGADINPAAATDPKTGAVLVAWQGWRDGNFDILVKKVGDDVATERRLTKTAANEWNPVAAFDSTGSLHVAFDTYEKGNYDVKLVSAANTTSPRAITIADSQRGEARASIAIDPQNRVWVAYEESPVNWAKDFGARWPGKSGVPFYLERRVIVRCVADGKVQQTKEDLVTAAIGNKNVGADQGLEGQRASMPRLSVDEAGRLWLLYRRHPLLTGLGEVWSSFAVYYEGDRWSPSVKLLDSDNLLDNRPALARAPGIGVLAVHSSKEGRKRGGKRAVAAIAGVPPGNNLYATALRADGPAPAPVLRAPPAVTEKFEPVHPNETADVQRIREYRIETGGKKYQLLRGEFHRHTELSSHRDMDGPLEEIWRYALDVARMDWIGNGDHMNGGREYTWWMVQKQTDMFFAPPVFTPMFTYERSVRYPSGHRNIIFAQRGIRPLTIEQGAVGTPETGAPDVKRLYAYLRRFDGICASHTSATNMGTDWRDNDPEREPMVEIFQGDRQNYEHFGAPVSPKPEDSIGGYQPAGFIWNALQKGYRLGFESSSDHISTHISYAVVLAEEHSRKGIVEAFKKRHCYGANDNIILDVRCGEHLMGDEFESSAPPKFEVHAVGTLPIAKVDIIRGVGNAVPTYVYSAEPKSADVRFSWTDSHAKPGEVSYYYVRIQQTSGALAWASPMWIHYKP